MATAEYRFIVEDLVGGFIIDEIPLVGAAYDEGLNRPGSLHGSLPLAHPLCTEEILDVGRRAIYVERNGRLDWGGVLLSANVAPGATSVSIVCEGWLGYWDHRDIWHSRTFEDTDQFDIFATLVADAQDTGLAENGAGADLSIDVTWDALSGVTRDRTEDYLDFQAKNVGEALRQLAALEDGFDYGMQYAYVSDQIVRTIRLWYPQRGKAAGIQFEYEPGRKTNVLRRGVSRDASRMAWRTRGWGSGADDLKLRSTEITEARRGIYPFLDRAVQFPSVVVQATLDANTRAALASLDHPLVLPTIEVDPDLDPLWGTYELGDTAHVRIDDAWASIDADHRIIGYMVAAAANRPSLLLQAA